MTPHPPFPSRWYKHLQEIAISQEADRVRIFHAVDNALSELSDKYKWKEAYLFGSITRSGKFRADSDVDIALKGLDKYQLYAFIGDISFLLKREVDVIRLEETPLSTAIIQKGIPWTPKTR
jgi:uncharacterized protein